MSTSNSNFFPQLIVFYYSQVAIFYIPSQIPSRLCFHLMELTDGAIAEEETTPSFPLPPPRGEGGRSVASRWRSAVLWSP